MTTITKLATDILDSLPVAGFIQLRKARREYCKGNLRLDQVNSMINLWLDKHSQKDKDLMTLWFTTV